MFCDLHYGQWIRLQVRLPSSAWRKDFQCFSFYWHIIYWHWCGVCLYHTAVWSAWLIQWLSLCFSRPLEPEPLQQKYSFLSVGIFHRSNTQHRRWDSGFIWSSYVMEKKNSRPITKIRNTSKREYNILNVLKIYFGFSLNVCNKLYTFLLLLNVLKI